jgi:hypothetical protein
MSSEARTFLVLMGVAGVVLGVISVAVFSPMLSRDNHRYHRGRTDMRTLRTQAAGLNQQVETLDGQVTQLEDQSGTGISFGFISTTAGSGFTGVVLKAAAFFTPEDTWKDITDEMAELNNTGQGAFFNATGNFVQIQRTGRYMVQVVMTHQRAAGSTSNLIFGGIGLDGADPIAFLSASQLVISFWWQSVGARIFDLSADTQLRVFVKQILEGGGTTMVDVNFASIVCTITTF